jgi:hypothetical protein
LIELVFPSLNLDRSVVLTPSIFEMQVPLLSASVLFASVLASFTTQYVRPLAKTVKLNGGENWFMDFLFGVFKDVAA